MRWLLIVGGLAMMFNAAAGNITVKLLILEHLLGPTVGRIAYFLLGALVLFFGLTRKSQDSTTTADTESGY
jgi:hypothetical protein